MILSPTQLRELTGRVQRAAQRVGHGQVVQFPAAPIVEYASS